MALAGCPDSFLHHPYRIDSVDQTSAHTRRDLVEPGFQEQSNCMSINHQDDDVDLEALVNDMNSSFESLYSTYNVHSESTPLLQNGQLNRSQLPASGTNLLQPVSPRQKVQRSQPVRIMAVRRLQEEEQQFRTSSLPAIPNPFPELCSPTSSPVLAPGSLPQSQPANKQDVKVFSEDGTCKVVEILADMTARDLCQLLVYKSHCVDDNSWTLVEHHPLLGLERYLEDHELVVQVESTMGSESKFLFRKNYAKYECFKNPVNFFPEQMVACCQQSNGCIPQSQLLQNFLNSNSCPEIQGFLHVKELGRKSWKKLYACLRRSGLYCSTKGSSKEPRHLQLIADIEDSNVFSLVAGKKLYNAPSDYGFCIKPNRVRNETKELRLLCAEDEQSRTCWMTAFRLLKYGMLLYQNYRIPQQRKALLPHFTTPVRSVSENSLVAMDFSGQIGRVIENPVEAQSAALEEGHAWRKRSTRMNILGSQSPLHPSTLSTVIHKTQHWFHGRISREESHRLIQQQGLVDGLFLLRDSQSNPKAFVLTLCHHQKIKHFQILPCEDDGQMFFSLDDGSTRFTDLIQLVEFYQLNKGVLPCKLKHHCIRVAL
ncbi:growth factor receptor-bound protein 10 [Tiliqua scincoides]|uniref:growth factor receptor-bound protein 10 n=1 Tax=Tiliqua scincoides TaxID=71010 RepID=UPI003462A360